MSESLSARFVSHLETSRLIRPGLRVLVGYSGGADSTCLLHLLASVGLDVVAAHLHHGQREEASKEQALCEAFARDIGVGFVTGQADVPRMATELGMGLEEAGRHARYNFFTQASKQMQCDLIATAHTRTDHVETVLLNLTRGTGMAGLAGIPERRGNIVRPLLPFSREETREYCSENGFWFHDDPANSDYSFSRARIRHRVLPELASINPAVDSAIARMTHTVGEEDRFLNGMAAAALEQSEKPLNGELAFLTSNVEVAFFRETVATLPVVLFRRAMRLATEALGGALDQRQSQLILEGVREGNRGAITAEGGSVTVEWTPDDITVRQTQPNVPFRFPLTLPGETESEEFGWAFTAFEDVPSEEAPTRRSLEVELDKSSIKGPLYFRTAQSGDEMTPLGFDHNRKLSDLLGEAHLTLAARQRLPIVCDLVGPLWAPGVCLSNRARKSEATTRVIKLSFAQYPT